MRNFGLLVEILNNDGIIANAVYKNAGPTKDAAAVTKNILNAFNSYSCNDFKQLAIKMLESARRQAILNPDDFLEMVSRGYNAKTLLTIRNLTADEADFVNISKDTISSASRNWYGSKVQLNIETGTISFGAIKSFNQIGLYYEYVDQGYLEDDDCLNDEERARAVSECEEDIQYIDSDYSPETIPFAEFSNFIEKVSRADEYFMFGTSSLTYSEI